MIQSVVVHINKIGWGGGVTKSQELIALTKITWTWFLERKLQLAAEHFQAN